MYPLGHSHLLGGIRIAQVLTTNSSFSASPWSSLSSQSSSPSCKCHYYQDSHPLSGKGWFPVLPCCYLPPLYLTPSPRHAPFLWEERKQQSCIRGYLIMKARIDHHHRRHRKEGRAPLWVTIARHCVRFLRLPPPTHLLVMQRDQLYMMMVTIITIIIILIIIIIVPPPHFLLMQRDQLYINTLSDDDDGDNNNQ